MSVISLILSAGLSSRMGQPKALIEWKGKSFLSHAVHAAERAGVTKIAVVIGAHAEEILPEVKRLNAEAVVNENWRLGMGSSIKTGVAWIKKNHPEASGVLIQLSDQPKIEGAALSKLLSVHHENPSAVVSAKYENSPGVPALFPKNLFSVISDIRDDEGAKKILLSYRDQLILIEMHEAGDDIDTPEQLSVLRKTN